MYFRILTISKTNLLQTKSIILSVSKFVCEADSPYVAVGDPHVGYKLELNFARHGYVMIF